MEQTTRSPANPARYRANIQEKTDYSVRPEFRARDLPAEENSHAFVLKTISLFGLGAAAGKFAIGKLLKVSITGCRIKG